MKTLSKILLLSAVCCAMAICVASCEKEPQGPSQHEIEANFIGKWKLVSREGKNVVTDRRIICTYYPGGRCTQFNSGHDDIKDEYIWMNNIELKYSLNGNVLTEEMDGQWHESTIKSIDADRMTLSLDRISYKGQVTEVGQVWEFVKVTADFSQDIIGMWEGVEVTGEETYGGSEACIEYRADGSYTYYMKKGNGWAPSADTDNEYNVDGDWLAHRWRPEAGADYNYEWWDIESIKDGQMKWTALRAKEDGSTYSTTFTWKKVSPADVVPYLYFEAVEDGATVSLDTLGTFNILPSIEFSTDAQNWTAFDFSKPQTVTLAKAGDKVFWRNTGKESFFSTTRDRQRIDLVQFVIGEKKVVVGGNIMSLVDKSCQSLTIPCDYCFSGLFYDCTSLVSASELMLPATGLTESSYSRMFTGCTSLESAPELPATELAEFCYVAMFGNCSSLESAPELPATELAKSCYSTMFSGCTSLNTAPALPAKELAEYCYQYMFMDCSALESAPELPATKLAKFCYSAMFWGCTSLESAPELPATELAQMCYLFMFYNCENLKHIKVGFEKWGAEELAATLGWLSGVSPEGTFECPEGLEIEYGANYIPEGWTVETR